MNNLWKSFWIAVSLYSRLPAVRVDWQKPAMQYAYCFLPAIGLAEAGLVWLWWLFCRWQGIGVLLFAAGAVAWPVLVTGGIHLDGWCDAWDAFGSHASREEKLRIMKDPRLGAFGAIGCGMYFLVAAGAWGEIYPGGGVTAALALVGCLFARGLAGLAAALMPCARPDGLAAAFSSGAGQKKAAAALGVQLVLLAAVLLAVHPLAGFAVLAAQCALAAAEAWVFRRQLGGITGDLAGFLLLGCQLAGVLAAGLAA